MHFPTPRGCEERLGDFEPVLLRNRKAGSRRPHLRSSPAGQLPTGRRLAANRFSDFLEFDTEHIVQ
jgi:hypothetical protein